MRTFGRALEQHEASELARWAAEVHGRRAERARVVLLSAQGLSAARVAAELGLAIRTVYKWRERFSARGLEGLRDRPRPGQPRRLPLARRNEILRLTLEELPPVGQRWTIRSVAKHLEVTQHQVRKVWADHGVRPHAGRSFLVDERVLHGKGVRLLGLFVGTAYVALALQVRDNGLSPRVLRRVVSGRESAVRALLSAPPPAGLAPGADLQAFAGFLGRLEAAAPGSAIHLATARRHAAQAGEFDAFIPRHVTSSGKDCLSAWVDTVELWLEQTARVTPRGSELDELSPAIDHYLEAQPLRAFVWVREAPALRAGSVTILACRVADL